jgi:hypothetical protein
MVMHAPQAWFGQAMFFAPNPDFDAGITYYLKAQASSAVSIEISDENGNVIRHLQGSASKGINRVRWDLRADPPAAQPDAAPVAGRGGRGGATPIPLVAPGNYQVTLKVPGIARELKGAIAVERDPIVGTRR